MHVCPWNIMLSAISVALLAPPTQAAPGGQASETLISFNRLEEIFIPPRASLGILLDVRPRAAYEAGHLPGAIWVDAKQAQAIAARPGGLTDRAAWIDWITPLGIYPVSQVWVMDGDRQLEAARVWWLLRYLGVEQVGLINGNFALWQAQRRAVTGDVIQVSPHPFPVDFQTDRLATRDDVLASVKGNGSRIIDARSAEEWTGTQLLSKRGGHMPTACRVEWSDLVDQDGRFLPLNQLRTRFEAVGARRGESVITYCQSGRRSSVDAFAAEILGHPTRNFYLGWSDWGNADETPITTADQAPASAQPVAAMPPASKPFVVEYYYQCAWGTADEFLALFQRNHLPILRERMKDGEILKVSMTKPRIHTGEAVRWDYRVTIEFRDAVAAFNIAADEPIKRRLFPDQVKYRVEEQRRFAILLGHTDLPIDEVDLAQPVTAP